MPGGTRKVDNKYYYQQVSGINTIYDVENESGHRLTIGNLVDVDDFNRPVIDNGTTLTPSVMLVRGDFDNELLIYNPVEPPTMNIKCNVGCVNGNGNFTEWCGVNWMYGYSVTDGASATTMWNQGEYVGLRMVQYENLAVEGDPKMLSTSYDFNVALDGKDGYVQIFLKYVDANTSYQVYRVKYNNGYDTIRVDSYDDPFPEPWIEILSGSQNNDGTGTEYSSDSRVSVLTINMSAQQFMVLRNMGVDNIEIYVQTIITDR